MPLSIVEGVPSGKRRDILTKYSYTKALATGGGVPAWLNDNALNQDLAVTSIGVALNTYAQSGVTNPYNRQIANGIMHVPGLGESDWMGVFGSIAGGISNALTTKLLGNNPVNINYPTPPSEAPTTPVWLLPVALGGGALLIGYMLFRKR